MLNILDLSFSYDELPVLEGLSLSVADGELVAIMGESGCGKSTLLHLIAGLLKPTQGSISVDTEEITYVFQEPRLFPWLSLKENLLAPLAKQPDNAARVSEILQKVGLSGFEDYYPDELSGGMKSRASLARALLFDGKLFLLDEPFSALNEEMRASLATELRAELKARGATAILVTHQRTDAERFADRIIEL